MAYIVEKILLIAVAIILVALCVVIIVSLISFNQYDATKVEIERYIEHCEISQMVYAEEATSRSTTRPVYKMGVRCDKFSTTLEISEQQFAQFMVSEQVSIEVVVFEYEDGKQTMTYSIVD